MRFARLLQCDPVRAYEFARCARVRLFPIRADGARGIQKLFDQVVDARFPLDGAHVADHVACKPKHALVDAPTRPLHDHFIEQDACRTETFENVLKSE